MTQMEQKAGKGIFNGVNVKDRTLSNWQAAYPYLLSGDLDLVLEQRAKKAGKSLDEYRACYQKAYVTDIDSISIENDVIKFYVGEQETSCRYAYAGHKILTDSSAKKGVLMFTCQDD